MNFKDIETWKKIGLKLLFPHKLLIFFLVNISASLLVFAFCSKKCPEAVAYISYVLSAYALTVVCARMPEILKKAKSGIYNNKYANRYLTEQELRMRVSLYSGLIINICFAAFKVVMGVLFQSKWLFAMAGYNVILSVMRFILIKTDDGDRLHGLRSYRICGRLMFLLNIAISVIVVIVVFDNQEITYPGFMIYAIAAFTFYCMTMAIISMIKYRSRINPVFSAVKRLGMAKALVSIFTLQVAMLTQFGSAEGVSSPGRQMANGGTGFAVCIMINLIAIFMIVGVKKDYKEIKKGTNINGK